MPTLEPHWRKIKLLPNAVLISCFLRNVRSSFEMHVMLKLRTENPYCVLKFARVGLVIIWPLPVACGDEAQPFRTLMNTGRSIERYSIMTHIDSRWMRSQSILLYIQNLYLLFLAPRSPQYAFPPEFDIA